MFATSPARGVTTVCSLDLVYFSCVFFLFRFVLGLGFFLCFLSFGCPLLHEKLLDTWYIKLKKPKWWGGGQGLPWPRPTSACVRLPYPYKIAEGRRENNGGGRGRPVPVSLAYASPPPTHTKRGQPPYRSRSASGTPPLSRPRFPSRFVQKCVAPKRPKLLSRVLAPPPTGDFLLTPTFFFVDVLALTGPTLSTPV